VQIKKCHPSPHIIASKTNCVGYVEKRPFLPEFVLPSPWRWNGLISNLDSKSSWQTNPGVPLRIHPIMKINRPLASLLFAVALAAGPVAALSQQTSTDSGAKPGAKQDMKNAGHEASNAAKDAGNGTKQGTKKAYHSTKRGTKKAWHKTTSTTKGAVDGGKEGAKQPQP
jgi:hypothetical protein